MRQLLCRHLPRILLIIIAYAVMAYVVYRLYQNGTYRWLAWVAAAASVIELLRMPKFLYTHHFVLKKPAAYIRYARQDPTNILAMKLMSVEFLIMAVVAIVVCYALSLRHHLFRDPLLYVGMVLLLISIVLLSLARDYLRFCFDKD